MEFFNRKSLLSTRRTKVDYKGELTVMDPGKAVEIMFPPLDLDHVNDMIRSSGLSSGVTDDGKGGVHQQKTLQHPNQNEFEVHAKKKLLLNVDMPDYKVKQKAMKIVSGLSGVEAVAMDMKDKKLTVVGTIDPVHVVWKLRKVCHVEMVSIGPANEPEKKKEKPKEEGEKEELVDSSMSSLFSSSPSSLFSSSPSSSSSFSSSSDSRVTHDVFINFMSSRFLGSTSA